jgi:CRISPR/Cas system CSM-associated protein Csm3 (group 7 of RAMP superfamily)
MKTEAEFAQLVNNVDRLLRRQAATPFTSEMLLAAADLIFNVVVEIGREEWNDPVAVCQALTSLVLIILVNPQEGN